MNLTSWTLIPLSNTKTIDKREGWADLYRSRGFNPIPVHYVREDGRCSCRSGSKCPSPGKHPAINWTRYQRVRVNDDDIKFWWEGESRRHGVGIITGSISGNVFVVDVDCGPGKDGDETIDALQRRYEDLPETTTGLSLIHI